MKTLVFALFFTITASTAMAMDNLKTVCTMGTQQRVIEVVYESEGQVPCEVHYTKDAGPNVLWKYQNEMGNCERHAATFVEKQEGWGWNCAAASEVVIEQTQ